MGELLYYKCMTPAYLRTKAVSLNLDGSDDTELKIGPDDTQYESILHVPLFGKAKDALERSDLTVMINIAAEGAAVNCYDPLSVCITDHLNVMGVQLQDTSQYNKVGSGPYLGIYGQFGRTLLNPTIIKSAEKEKNFINAAWIRWPQTFNIKIKPNPKGDVFGAPAWGSCTSATGGGVSLSYVFPNKLDMERPLDLVLYRYKADKSYVINSIEVIIVKDADDKTST